MAKSPTKAQFVEAYGQERNTNILLEERLAELELALEDQEWLKLSLTGEREFSREGLGKIVRLSRLMFLKNPLINHAAERSLSCKYSFSVFVMVLPCLTAF